MNQGYEFIKKNQENLNMWIVNYVTRTGHQAGKCIHQDELDSLSKDLFDRLGIPLDKLEYNLDMLSEIEERIFDYYPYLYEIPDLEEMRIEIAKLTREITAYFGKLVLLTKKWEWFYHENSSLIGTSVIDKKTRLIIGGLVSVFLDRMYFNPDRYKKDGASYLVKEYFRRIIRKDFSDSI